MPTSAHRALAALLVSAAGVFLVGCVSGPATAADAKTAAPSARELAGAWSAMLCDRPDPRQECGRFTIELVETAQGLCGQHFLATPGLARLDEGEPGSVLGNGRGRGGVLVVRSGRNSALYMARIERRGAGLTWTRVGMVEAGQDTEPPILPKTLTLRRDDSASARERLRALQDAGCRWPDWTE